MALSDNVYVAERQLPYLDKGCRGFESTIKTDSSKGRKAALQPILNTCKEKRVYLQSPLKLRLTTTTTTTNAESVKCLVRKHNCAVLSPVVPALTTALN